MLILGLFKDIIQSVTLDKNIIFCLALHFKNLVLAHVKYPGFQESKSHSPVLKHTQAHGISDALFFATDI